MIKEQPGRVSYIKILSFWSEVISRNGLARSGNISRFQFFLSETIPRNGLARPGDISDH